MGRFRGTGNHGRIVGPRPEGAGERAALASLYVALMINVDLDLLASTGDVIVDGSFAENPIFTGLLAALRPGQAISMSRAKNGTALGAALLWGWPRTGNLDLEPAAAADIDGLHAYADAWRARISS